MKTRGQPPPARSTSGLASERGAHRHKVFLVAELIDAAGAHRAHVLDISTSGALLHCEDELVVADKIGVHLGAKVREATVASITGPRLGVMFSQPLQRYEVEKLLLG